MKKTDTYFLVKGLKNGNLSCLEELYKMYYSKLYGFAKKFDSTTMTPDDFVQQTFLKLWEKRNKLNEDILFDKQLYTICKNLILNIVKRDAKASSLSEEKLSTEENSHTGEDFDAKNKKLEWLYDTIQKLPPKRKKVFLLHKIQNLTYGEIATALEISKKTIANHLYLANIFLKEESRKE